MVMGKNARREYLNAIRPRYKKADKTTKKALLDEFCQVCGYPGTTLQDTYSL